MGEDVRQLLDRIEGLLRSDDEAALIAELSGDRPEDLAEVFELLDDEERSRIIFALPPRTAAEVIALFNQENLEAVETSGAHCQDSDADAAATARLS